MQDLNDLFYFAQVVQHAGFSPAARALGIQKSKLSRRLGLLEERLGVRLINRSSRRFSITDVGQEYYRHCMTMLVEAEGAQAIIDNVKSAPQGIIRVACPPGLLAYRIGEAIAHFLAAYPKIEMQVKAFNRRVDLVGEGYDVVVRIGQPLTEPTTLATRKLGEISQCLVASPRLFDSSPFPETPSDLESLPTLDFGFHLADRSGGNYEWRLERKGGPIITVPHRPRLVTDDLSSMRAAAVAGIGIAQLPSLMIESDVAAGRLIVLLPAWQLPNESVYAIFPSRRGLLPSIRALLDLLVAECIPYRTGIVPEHSAPEGARHPHGFVLSGDT